MAVERTFLMIKPDGVKRNLQMIIAQIFVEKGLKLIGMKLMNVSRELAEKHYADLSSKPFFGELVDYIVSGPVVALAFEGESAITVCRTLIGATNPQAAAPGTIRSKYALTVAENVIHGSDSVENGEKELALWFPEGLVA